jgi:signal peptidase I
VFGLFASQEKKVRQQAAHWLELGEKVYHFRRDALPAADVGDLQARCAQLRSELRARDNVARLKLGIEALEGVLQRTGGRIYPKSSLVENVEFFLVAAIVILGIRSYFVQPFKIPTNSMWPSYHGMTPEVFRERAEEPGTIARAFRFVAFGARSRRLDAPRSGEVLLPIGNADGRGIVHYRLVDGRSWFVFPTKLREYSLYVDDAPVTVRVPADFDFDWAIREAFFPNEARLEDALRAQAEKGGVEWRTVPEDGRMVRMQFVRAGREVRAGERLLSFDILTGDQLFVDRMSYHFIQPSVGSGFVFRTGNIPGIQSVYGDQYYIKRLVGGPGDRLEIVRGATPADGGRNGLRRDTTGVLLRNGEPIDGAAAFRKNNGREGKYAGYQAQGLLAFGQKIQVPEHAFFALGDNSGNSADGRSWGFVPEKDVVGRPLLIYFPFTKRWGPAR